jgi:tetratricopeptide (TPR) repeat protein
MEKNKLLDTDDNSKKLTLLSKRSLAICLITFLWSVMSLSSCSLPRIIVFEDTLTPEEHLNLGVAYEKKKEFDSAVRHYKLAAKNLPRAQLYLGNAYLLTGELDRAEKHYKKAIKNEPQNADAYNNLAWLYYVKGKALDEAERLALKAIEINPSKKDIYENTLSCIRGHKKFKE